MKREYIPKEFNDEQTVLIARINGIIDDFAADNYDLSVRQLFYQLVTLNAVTNNLRSYKTIATLISDARLAGLIDWDIIKDRTRECVINPHWESPADIIEACANQFKVDMWADQPEYLEVMIEKQALEGVLIPVCAQWDVPFTANRGYSSSSTMYEAGRRLYKRLRDEKPVTVLYLGDHDPSGLDMTRDVEERLRLFTDSTLDDTITVNVERIALNMPQIEELNPPENPAKMSDSRAEEYVKRYGNSSWELDAINPRQLAELVGNAIQQHIDTRIWAASLKKQTAGREALTKMATDARKPQRKTKRK